MHLPLEIAVSGRENANVDLAIADPTHPAHSSLLDGPKQLPLKRGLQVADLVEE